MAWTAVVALALGFAGSASAESVVGENLEARNADVWTGQCFANAEIGIVGNKATLAWKVTEGSFNGVKLDGLSIVAVVIGDGTFGVDKSIKTKTALLVDERANLQQREALIAMARKGAGTTIQEVVRVEVATIELATGLCEGLGCARLDAGASKIVTRCMSHKDTICGHEELIRPTLAKTTDEYAAYALEHKYAGKALGETFDDANARSAIIAKFSY
jgi:hypothetical protein